MFQKIIISILLIFFSGCGKEKKVNIVYILADDLGYGELGVYGQEIIETPNIDELAKKECYLQITTLVHLFVRHQDQFF